MGKKYEVKGRERKRNERKVRRPVLTSVCDGLFPHTTKKTKMWIKDIKEYKLH